MKILIPLLAALAWPAAGEASSRFELHSRLTPLPEAPAGRFAISTRLERLPESRPDVSGRFGLKAPAPTGAACADVLFQDSFE